MRFAPYVDENVDLIDADFLETYGVDYFSLAEDDYARAALLTCNLPSSSRFMKKVDPLTFFHDDQYMLAMIERNLRYVVWAIQFQNADKKYARQRAESEPRDLILPPDIKEILDQHEREKNKESREEMSIEELKAILSAPRVKAAEPEVLTD